MNHAFLTQQALTDLEDIYDYAARRYGMETAQGTIQELKKKCRYLAQSPRLGRPRPDLHEGLRSFPWGPFTIFYQIVDENVEILRFYHHSRNLEKWDEGK